jgi:RNA polymerase sigma-70 factor (ECF subfamily)
MDPAGRRSSDVSPALAVAPEVPRAEPRSSFEDLYRSCRDDVYAYVASLLRDPAAAEDVVALAFERAYRRRSGWDARRGSQRAWIFGIARNAALDELRRRKRTAALGAEPVAADEPAAAEEADEHALRRSSVRAALAELSPRERELVGLKFHAGLSHSELALVLGVSPTNAATMLHRTIQKLRKACHATP